MPSPARIHAIDSAQAILDLYKIAKARRNTLVNSIDISNDLEQLQRDIICQNDIMRNLKAEFRATTIQF